MTFSHEEANARLLDLVGEWWTGNQVNDRSREPHYPLNCCSHTDWQTCRRVREQLLAAASKQGTRQ